jgi:hypothetical protein
MLRPTVSRAVCPGVGHYLGPMTRFFFYCLTKLRVHYATRRKVAGSSPDVIEFFLCFTWCGAPSLTRGCVGNLLVQLLLGLPAQSLSDSRPTELITIFNYRIWDSLNLEGQVPVFISLGSGFPFSGLLRLAGLWWRYPNPPPNGVVFGTRHSWLLHTATTD